MAICRTVVVHTDIEDKTLLNELKKKIKEYEIQVERDRLVEYPIGKKPRVKKIPTIFVSVDPDPCVIGKETEVKILSEDEVTLLKELDLDSVDELLTRAGCEVLKEGNEVRYYSCPNGTLRAIPYKGGVWITQVNKIEL